jgi:hypothetical protein
MAAIAPEKLRGTQIRKVLRNPTPTCPSPDWWGGQCRLSITRPPASPDRRWKASRSRASWRRHVIVRAHARGRSVRLYRIRPGWLVGLTDNAFWRDRSDRGRLDMTGFAACQRHSAMPGLTTAPDHAQRRQSQRSTTILPNAPRSLILAIALRASLKEKRSEIRGYLASLQTHISMSPSSQKRVVCGLPGRRRYCTPFAW